MTEITQPIPARLRNVAVNGHVAGAADIIDDNLNKTQDEINQQIAEIGDKPYDPTEFSGMGRKALSKNIQTVGGEEKNVLMQEMMPLATGQNTIYVIQYDYVLGENITVPENCVLEFDGGSISGNYTIIGNNTALVGLKDDCLLTSFSGSFADMIVNASYFGLHPNGDGTVNNTQNQQVLFEKLNSLVNSTKNITINFERGFYGFGGETMDKPSNYANANRLFYGLYGFCVTNAGITESFKIQGNGCEFVNVYKNHIGFWADLGSGLEPVNNYQSPLSTYTYQGHSYKYGSECGGFIFCENQGKRVDYIFDNFTVDMHSENLLYGGTTAATVGQTNIEIRETAGNIIVTRVVSKNAVSDCFRIGGSLINGSVPNNVLLSQCSFINGIRTCAALSGGFNILVDDCDFEDAGQIFDTAGGLYRFEDPWCAIDIEPFRNMSIVKKIVIRNCRFKDSNKAYIVSQNSDAYEIGVFGCTAEATKKGKEYDANGRVVDSEYLGGFFNVGVIEKATADNITLTNIPFGAFEVFHAPKDERPEGFDESDTTKQYLYSEYYPKGISNIGCVTILSKRGTLDGTPLGIVGGDYHSYVLKYVNNGWGWYNRNYSAQPIINNCLTNIDTLYIKLVDTFCITNRNISIPSEFHINNLIIELNGSFSGYLFTVAGFGGKIENVTVLDTNAEEAGTGYLLSPGAQSVFGNQNIVRNYNYVKVSGENRAVLSSGSTVINNENYGWSAYDPTRITPLVGKSRLYLPLRDSLEYAFIGNLPIFRSGETMETYFPNTNKIMVPHSENEASLTYTHAFTLFGRNGSNRNFVKRYFGTIDICGKHSIADLATLKTDDDVVAGGLNPGEQVYDTSKKQMIIGTGTGVGNNIQTVRYDGEVYDIRTSGTFAQRPTPTNVGFPYFCISGASIDGGTTEKTNIVIYYTGSEWVDANGNTVSAYTS